jgi:exonuclease III
MVGGRKSMVMDCDNMLIWNVRGLNSGSHHDALHSLVASERLSLICIQETKLVVISDFDLVQLIGAGYEYSLLLAAGSCAGILVAWKSSTWSASKVSMRSYSVLVRLKHELSSIEWWFMAV